MAGEAEASKMGFGEAQVCSPSSLRGSGRMILEPRRPRPADLVRSISKTNIVNEYI